MSAPWLVLVLALSGAAGPSGGAPTAIEASAAAEDPAAEPHGALSSGGSFWIEWWPDPAPVPLNELFRIHFRVLEPGEPGAPVPGAVITADAWMPGHGHGTTLVPRIESHRDGTATGEGFLLHMEGRWELRVGVAVDGRMERAVFPLDLEP